MDARQFDELAISVRDVDSTRRTILRRAGGGGLAALAAALGLGASGAEDAEAKKRRRRRKRRKNRGGGAGGGGTTVNAGYSVTVNNAGLLGTTCTTGDLAACGGLLGGLLCTAGICVLSPATLLNITPLGGCTTGAQCASGACNNGQCVNCDAALNLELCGTTTRQCCVAEANCINGLCVLPS